MPQWINFKELRSKLQFPEVLRHYHINFKMRDTRATALCPLPGHPERTDGQPRTASLSINLSRNIFQCFGCKASGNVLDFACRMEGFDPSDTEQFRKGALKVADIFGVSTEQPGRADSRAKADPPPPVVPPVPTSSPQPVVVNAPLDFELKDLDPAHPYLLGRGFYPETINHFGLGYCNRGLMKARAVIPLHDPDGRLVGYAGRATKDSMITDEFPKYRFPGDRVRDDVRYEFHKSLLLYNYHRIRSRALDVIVVEGFASTWWLHQCGFWNVVALMGSSCSDEQADLIAAIAARVWFMTDGDDAGCLCAESLWEQLGSRVHCRNLKLGEERQPTSLSPDELHRLLGGGRRS